jgi:Na+/H+ antiporter NhaD/arsenite permease-like protein
VLKQGMLEPLVPEAILLFFIALVIAIEGVRDSHFIAVISVQKR